LLKNLSILAANVEDRFSADSASKKVDKSTNKRVMC